MTTRLLPLTTPALGLILALATTATLPVTGFAAGAEARLSQWPAWRGPLANGTAPKADPPLEWSETNHVKWKVALPGRGTATPIVWDQRVYVLTAIPTGKKEAAPTPAAQGDGPMRGMVDAPSDVQQFVVMSIDRATGKTVWQQTAREALPHQGHHKDHGFASASPVTDGERVYASFGSYGVYAYDLTGKLIWKKDLGPLQTRNSFGEGSSPALAGNKLIILRDHEGDDCILALDTRDGRELWRTVREEPTGWCTPLIVEQNGRQQIVVNGTNRIRSYDAETGKLLWECGGMTANAIPSAVAGADRVIVTSGFRGSACVALKLDRTGDLTGTDGVLWNLNRNTPYVPSPLLAGDLLYLLSGNNAVLTVVDAASGKVQIDAQRLEGMLGVYASPVAAADRVYVAGRDGRVFVLKRSPTLEVLARNRLDDAFDASPALVDRELFLRGRQNLYCIAP